MNDEPIDRNPDILGGTPVFSHTRVPVRILMEYLEAATGSMTSFRTSLRCPAIKPSRCWRRPG